MLYLNEQDIHQAASRGELLDELEGALRQQELGGFFMPPRVHVDHGENTLLLMPCLTQSFIGTKLVTIFPGNVKRNAPSVNAVMVLNSADTGETLAILDGRTLTALRTGAVGGVGMRHLCPPGTESLGIVGTGVQGFNQALFASSARALKVIHVFGRNPAGVSLLVEKLSAALPGIQIRAAATVESLLESSQAVITATSSADPVLPDNELLLKGKLFIGIGSYKPTMREFPESLFHLVSRIFVDTAHASEESGDLAVPLAKGWITHEQIKPLGQLLMEQKGDACLPQETILFKAVGMALLDVSIAGFIYQKALEKGLGQSL